MRRLLIVRTSAGLCNRVRALLGGAAYAAAVGRAFRFVWQPSAMCEATFGELWDSPYRSIDSRLTSIVARVFGVTSDVRIPFDDPRRVVLTTTGHALLEGDPRVRRWQELLPLLRVKPTLAERIERTWRPRLRSRVSVGVMIRAGATAHADTKASSPPEWFFGRMEEIRSRHPEVEFFLSTETKAVSDEVHRRFANVTELADKSAFNSSAGVQDAVCDLYLLASTNYIIGSEASSFSLTAGYLAAHDGYESARTASPVTLDVRLAAPPGPPPCLVDEGARGAT